MKAEKGIWKIETGKGDRVYINCDREESVAHPQLICKENGMCIYGYDNLKDLAIAILRFERDKQAAESIASQI